jgi:hypothetical protein
LENARRTTKKLGNLIAGRKRRVASDVGGLSDSPIRAVDKVPDPSAGPFVCIVVLRSGGLSKGGGDEKKNKN